MNKDILIKALEERIEEAKTLNNLDEYDDYIKGMLDLVEYIECDYDSIVAMNTLVGELLGKAKD